MKKSDKWLESYKLNVNNVLIDVNIVQKAEEPVPSYYVNITNMSNTTKIILEKLREEFVSRIGLGVSEISAASDLQKIKQQFKKEISMLLAKYFPNSDEKTKDMLINYIIEQNLGLGNIDILLNDKEIEEIVINSAKEPVWVYHRKHAWVKTNIIIPTEARIRHFSTMIGRDVNKEITNLNPLMDAHLITGDRVNATLNPISSNGNTITIRKFSPDPWTITNFLKNGTMAYEVAAIVWLCMENELSILIAGGTGSGKTSMLNVIASFLPPNQRVISIEDTRELQLPKTLHWVPLETRMPNPEGKGGVSMLDLVVNSLRMRPDRIIMGEIRRKEEAEVLFEAMHTGHSVYGTFHANNAEETVKRLTNPPIEVPKSVLSALGGILIQNRNRKKNVRRSLQFAELLKTGDISVIYQYDPNTDSMNKVNEFKAIAETLDLYAGINKKAMEENLIKKTEILHWLVDKKITKLDQIGKIMSDYYKGHLKLHD